MVTVIEMEYKLLVGSTSQLSKKVKEYLDNGWKLHGDTFKTGNSICYGDPAYPINCTYTSEVGQAVIKE